ncbi:MAG: methyltransferase domain-containing protein [Myxococcota bacterium]
MDRGAAARVGEGGELTLNDKDRWDQKYRAREKSPGEPHPFIEHWSRRFPAGGEVLDLAGGDGRHAIPLARRGHSVTVVDVSTVGLERLKRFSTGLPVRGVARDLTSEEALQGLGPFAAAVIAFYKPAPWLWHPLARAVPPEGWIVLATFNDLHAAATGFPKRFSLERDELLHPHPGLELEHQERNESWDGYVWRRA